MTFKYLRNQIKDYLSKDLTTDALEICLRYSPDEYFNGKILILFSRLYHYRGENLLGKIQDKQILKEINLEVLTLWNEMELKIPTPDGEPSISSQEKTKGFKESSRIDFKSSKYTLTQRLEQVLDFSYTEKWENEWLSLPISNCENSPYTFHVICSDLPKIKNTFPLSWPPKSQEPKIWIQWFVNGEEGFWIRPRKFDPIIRNRFILIETDEIIEQERKSKINRKSVLNACYFSALSNRIVWHNPKNGGASSPKSAHFQSMPLYTDDSFRGHYSLPCCNFEVGKTPWYEKTREGHCLINYGFKENEYPVLGVVLWGKITYVSAKVWEIIEEYDSSLSCNLIIQPSPNQDVTEPMIRVFIFPRNRRTPNHQITDSILEDDEKILLNNNRGGIKGNWSYAGIEMGLLTQVEWGNLFSLMKSNPSKWGKTLIKLLNNLSLKEDSPDWQEFSRISKKVLF